MGGWKKGTLFCPTDEAPASGESFDTIGTLNGIRIERIHSSSTPDTSLQRQPHDEWVALLFGQATLELFSGGVGTEVTLVAGETLFIGAETPHRVLTISHGALWLALHAPSPR